MLEAAVVGIDGDALLWYQWEYRRQPIQRWEELKALMLRRFRPSNAGKLHEQWLGVRQTDIVADYRISFIELAAPLKNVSEDMALGIFLNGLRGDIKTELRVQNPGDVDQAMALAIRGKTGSGQDSLLGPSPTTPLSLILLTQAQTLTPTYQSHPKTRTTNPQTHNNYPTQTEPLHATQFPEPKTPTIPPEP